MAEVSVEMNLMIAGLQAALAAARAENIRLDAEVRRRGNIIAELQWRSGNSLGGILKNFKPPGSSPYSDGFGRR